MDKLKTQENSIGTFNEIPEEEMQDIFAGEPIIMIIKNMFIEFYEFLSK